jgi:peptidoglycan/LPS O-acetylase OafA/YrhL
MSDIKKDVTYSSLENIGKNNFDILRFLLAFTVFLVHASFLSGAFSLQDIPRYLSSEFAVKSFFVVSGFLIFMSYESSHNVKDYLLKRVRRIYPGYVFVIIASALLGFAITAYPSKLYFDNEFIKYLASNLIFLNFLHPGLPGVFLENHVEAVNGALWTLKIEVMFYLCVPIFVWLFRRYGRLAVLSFMYLVSILYITLITYYSQSDQSGLWVEILRQLPGQLPFFIAGAIGYYYFSYIDKHAYLLIFFAITLFVFRQHLYAFIWEPFAIGVFVIMFATKLPFLGRFAKYGDVSYGVYILHFPILQLFISYGFFEHSPWPSLIGVSIVLLTLAFLSWHLIEKPFLKKSSHYISERYKK